MRKASALFVPGTDLCRVGIAAKDCLTAKGSNGHAPENRPGKSRDALTLPWLKPGDSHFSETRLTGFMSLSQRWSFHERFWSLGPSGSRVSRGTVFPQEPFSLTGDVDRRVEVAVVAAPTYRAGPRTDGERQLIEHVSTGGARLA